MSNPDLSLRFVMELLRADIRRIFSRPWAVLFTMACFVFLSAALIYVPGFWQEYVWFVMTTVLASPVVWLFEDMMRPRTPKPPPAIPLTPPRNLTKLEPNETKHRGTPP